MTTLETLALAAEDYISLLRKLMSVSVRPRSSFHLPFHASIKALPSYVGTRPKRPQSRARAPRKPRVGLCVARIGTVRGRDVKCRAGRVRPWTWQRHSQVHVAQSLSRQDARFRGRALGRRTRQPGSVGPRPVYTDGRRR